MRRPRRILVIRPDRIGDVVVATPVFRALRMHFPDAFLAALVRPVTEPILRHNPRLDTVLVDDYEGAHAGRAGFLDRLRLLRSLRFDTALMLLPTERHAWMTFLAGIPHRIGVGTKLYQALTFTRSVSRNKYIPLRHEADYNLDLARRLGVNSDDLSAELFLTEEELSHAEGLLAARGRDISRPLVTLHPENGGSAPNWTAGVYVDLARNLIDTLPDAQILVLLSPAGRALGEMFTGISSERILSPLVESDLRMVMGCIGASDVTVSASTGPMHLAAGLKIPTVNMFCPLTACSPFLWGPKGNRAEIILPPEHYCRRQCPGDPKLCTFEGGIGVEDVARAVANSLSKIRA